MTNRRKPPIPASPSHDLRGRILEYFQTLRIPMSADELDAALAQAEKQRWGPLELLSHVLSPLAELLRNLTASLADHSLPQRLRYYSNFDLLAIDEFGFDRIERAECGQAASLLYKVVDSRGPQRSTAMVTNISFEAWADYLGDAPLAMAILDRLVDGAIVLKIEGRSYRAHRSKHSATPAPAEIPKSKRRRRSTGEIPGPLL